VIVVLRRRADRARSSAVRLLATAGCALVVALGGCGGSSGTRGPVAGDPSTLARTPAIGPAPGRGTYTLMQMNLCLSGLGDCNGKPGYPGAVDEAVARIRQVRPDAVTLNETCRGDVARIARRTRYHLRFSRVIYGGELLSCVRPAGRGLFGDAVLTKATVTSADNHDFTGQAGPERRRWLCVSTRAGVDVCTAHLNTLSAVEADGNVRQCAELRGILARRASARTVIFGGDVNRRGSCAPGGVWTRTDSSAHQAPGLQHVYGSRTLRSPAAQVIPATNTDHDILVVRARLTARRG
jgi:endonuclease/exonuclease/phosphatase family metal-dependent hydrolase